eukprot:scaffold64_cov338-Pavlova_lutheri.AAC.32
MAPLFLSQHASLSTARHAFECVLTCIFDPFAVTRSLFLHHILFILASGTSRCMMDCMRATREIGAIWKGKTIIPCWELSIDSGTLSTVVENSLTDFSSMLV